MKTLLLVCVLCCAAQGQNPDPILPSYGEKVQPINLEKLAAEITLKWWDEYKIECYNDSALTSYSITGIDFTDTTGRRFRVIPNYGHWTQPTFSGFMEFIRKKAK